MQLALSITEERKHACLVRDTVVSNCAVMQVDHKGDASQKQSG